MTRKLKGRLGEARFIYSVLAALALSAGLLWSINNATHLSGFSFTRTDHERSFRFDNESFSLWYNKTSIQATEIVGGWGRKETSMGTRLILPGKQNGSIFFDLVGYTRRGHVFFSYECWGSLNLKLKVYGSRDSQPAVYENLPCHANSIDMTSQLAGTDRAVFELFFDNPSNNDAEILYIDFSSFDGTPLSQSVIISFMTLVYGLVTLIIICRAHAQGTGGTASFLVFSILASGLWGLVIFAAGIDVGLSFIKAALFTAMLYYAGIAVINQYNGRPASYSAPVLLLLLLIMGHSLQAGLEEISRQEGQRMGWDAYEYMRNAEVLNPQNFYQTEAREPFFSLVLKLFFNLFGTSETLQRLVGLIFLLQVIYLTYLIGKEYLNTTTGIIASALVPWHEHMIYFSTVGYRMTVYTVLLLIYFYVLFVRKNMHSLTRAILIGAVCSAIVLTREETIVFILLPLAYHLLIVKTFFTVRSRKAIAAMLIMFLIITGPFIYFQETANKNGLVKTWKLKLVIDLSGKTYEVKYTEHMGLLDFMLSQNPATVIKWILKGGQQSLSYLTSPIQYNKNAAYAFQFILVLGAFSLARRKKLTLIFIPLAYLIPYLPTTYFQLYPRYLLHAYPYIALTAAYPVSMILRKIGGRISKPPSMNSND